MKVPFSQFFANLRIFPKKEKIVIGIIIPIQNTENFEAKDFRSNQPQTLEEYLQRYYSCADSETKMNYLVEMYNAGFQQEAIEINEKRITKIKI